MLPPNLARALAKGTVMSCYFYFFFILEKKNYRKMFLMKIASFNNVLNTTTVETWKHTPLETTEFQIPKLISPPVFHKAKW